MSGTYKEFEDFQNAQSNAMTCLGNELGHKNNVPLQIIEDKYDELLKEELLKNLTDVH